MVGCGSGSAKVQDSIDLVDDTVVGEDIKATTLHR
jgi:hypothetical protein